MYESTVRLARPMAFPISAELILEFLEYARRAVSLASSRTIEETGICFVC
jgi:hypothetical protein